MKLLGLNDIREAYLSFFEKKGHLRLQSASLIPKNDKSLLLIAAGMAPLKPYFTGQETPPSPRAVSCQKCVRTNDIENVGRTSRHCTFFEMLGNFSFGDYFKEDAIPWAWEFLTEVLEIPAERLYPSVYVDDDEAFAIWRDKVSIHEERITRLGKDDNFWEHGAGPCGPSSEIYFDRGIEHGCGNLACRPGCDCDRFVEVWNLVFTQYNKEEDGSYTTLKQKNIDTGMGLERIASAIQGVATVFDVDTIKAVRDAVCKATKTNYGASAKADASIRIITDHARAVTFMLSDGILPSNEGRGYVLRRLLRRAALHGKLLGADGLFLTGVSETVVAISEGAYPELREKAGYISKLIDMEEKRFHETLDQGMEVVKKFLSTLRERLTPELLGSEAFVLYDTYGFPPELTQELILGEGLDLMIDMSTFTAEMEKQRARARGAREESNFMGAEETALTRLPAGMSTVFEGYTADCVTGAVIRAMISGDEAVTVAHAGDELIFVPDRTPLYAESGGQKSDTGIIVTDTGTAEITDCQRLGNKMAHYARVINGELKLEQAARIELDINRRMSIARNHTATHLLHKALRDALGEHVEQAGSLVTSERLRFDFTHFQPLTAAELRAVEDTVNERALCGFTIAVTETSPSKAREMGAIALFGEKYGDSVRVVDMGGWSVELCGGTHLDNTAKIGMFKILSETGVAAGVRRIEAVTGMNTVAYYHNVEERLRDASALLKASPDNLVARITSFIADRAEQARELSRLKLLQSSGLVDEICKNSELIKGIKVAAAVSEAADADSQRALADKLRDKLGSGLAILYFPGEGKGTLLCTATDDAVKAGVHCGNIVRETARVFGGNGGGRPNMAQAGIPVDVSPQDVLSKAKSFI